MATANTTWDLFNYLDYLSDDAEALYSFEGTKEMNTLIVGKHITGLSVFVH